MSYVSVCSTFFCSYWPVTGEKGRIWKWSIVSPHFQQEEKHTFSKVFFFFFKAFVLHVGGYVLHLKRHTREMDSAWMGTDVMDILFLSSRLVNQSEIRRRENESCHGITQEIKVNIFFFLSMKMRESSVFRLSFFSFPSLRWTQREAKLRTIIPPMQKNTKCVTRHPSLLFRSLFVFSSNGKREKRLFGNDLWIHTGIRGKSCNCFSGRDGRMCGSDWVTYFIFIIHGARLLLSSLSFLYGAHWLLFPT